MTHLRIWTFLFLFISSLSFSSGQDIPINLKFKYDHNLGLTDCIENTITWQVRVSSPSQPVELDGMEVRIVYDRAIALNMIMTTELSGYVAVEISEVESSSQAGIDFFDFGDAAVFFEGELNFISGTRIVLDVVPQTLFEITLEDVPLVNDEFHVFCAHLLWNQISNDPGALSFDGVTPSVEVEFFGTPLGSHEIADHYGWDYGLPSGLFGGIDSIESCTTYCAPFDFHVPVPVEWENFESARVSDMIELNWQTSQEVNNSHFIIQRAANGNDFTDIGRVEGNGNSNTIKSFEFIDRAPMLENNYYRIKQVDYDGAHSYSETRLENYSDGSDSELLVFPNPAKEYLTIGIEKNHSFEKLIIYDINGKIVMSQNMLTSKGNNQVDISSMNEGYYFLKVQGMGFEKITSFIKIGN